MKLFLLELTEKETDYLHEALVNSLQLALAADLRETEKERYIARFSNLADKLKVATQPRDNDLLSNRDLHDIISMAKKEYLSLPHDLHISNKVVEPTDFKHIALVNAAIMVFNSKNLMKNVAKFDYTDKSGDYEETE